MKLHRQRSSFTVAALLLILIMGVSATPAAAANGTPASITLSSESGPAGSSLTVSGKGFSRTTAGTVTLGATSSTIQTRPNGTFIAVLTIPDTSETAQMVHASAGSTSATALFTVTFGAVSNDIDPTATPPLITSTTTTSETTSTSRLRFGVATPGGAQANSELDAVAALINENPSIVLSYKDFGQLPSIAELDSVAARGATSLVTWEPWLWGGGLNQTAYSSDNITAGHFDAYLTQWGESLNAWGKPLMLRYGHEMNGNWYPWSDDVNGNSTGDYVAAWRHVHDVVTAAGATNVSWVWSPNVPYTGSSPLTGLYPGGAYVDVVALDGYNWGTSAAWSHWQAPATLFDTGLAQLRTLAPGKQILIAETGSAEAGGSKAEWNTALVAYLARQPDVTGFVWFDFLKETDWRINSSTSSTKALAEALAAR